MAFRYKLIHHPKASEDYYSALEFFQDIDPSLARIFQEDFKVALRGLATGRAPTVLYADGSTIRWVKLRRFSHKIFFDAADAETRFVLAIISGKRSPRRIKATLGRRKKRP